MKDALISLGLTHYEANAMEVLSTQACTLKTLSKAARIPFGKVYSVVKSLKKKGLVKESATRPKKVSVEHYSLAVKTLIDEDQMARERIYQLLRASASETDRERKQTSPFFQIGVTYEENESIQMRTFTECKEEVLQILNIHHKPTSNRGAKTRWERTIMKALERGVTFKAMYPEKMVLPKLVKNAIKKHPKGFLVKRINTDFIRCDIIDGKKVLLKLVQPDIMQFGGILFIEDKRFAEHLRKLFFNLWEEH